MTDGKGGKGDNAIFQERGGGFSPMSYRRIRDDLIDIEHNRYLIEEAIFAIHQRLATCSEATTISNKPPRVNCKTTIKYNEK